MFAEPDGGITLFPVVRVPPDGKNGVQPAFLCLNRMSGEDFAAHRFQRRRLDSEIGHLRLHVSLHPWRFLGIGVFAQRLPQRAAKFG